MGTYSTLHIMPRNEDLSEHLSPSLRLHAITLFVVRLWLNSDVFNALGVPCFLLGCLGGGHRTTVDFTVNSMRRRNEFFFIISRSLVSAAYV